MKVLLSIFIAVSVFIFPSAAFAHGNSGSAIRDVLFSSTELSSDISTSTTVKNVIQNIDRERQLNDYVDANYYNIQNDAALGRGEYLEVLYELGGFEDKISKDNFLKEIQASYDVLFLKKESGNVFILKLKNIVIPID